MKYNYELIRSDRKTLGLQVKDGRIIVRAPHRASVQQIERFVREHEAWIENALSRQAAKKAAHPEPTATERTEYIRLAKEMLPRRTAFWSERMGLTPTQIRITSAQRRFGSCSSEGHICYSWRLMQYPPEAIDYVVVHELCHRLHMDHSREFWKEVGRVLPDYKERRKWLKENGRFYVESLNEEI